MAIQKYIIANLSDVSVQMWSDAYQTKELAHISNDGLEAILSYRGNKPSSFGDSKVFSNAEIIEELKKDNWYVNIDDDGNIITGE